MAVEGAVRFEFHDQEVMALLQGLEIALSPVGIASILGGDIADWFQNRITDRFVEQGDDASGQWTPLAEATQAIRASLGYGASGPINVRTGELYKFVRESKAVAPNGFGATLKIPGEEPQGELAQKMMHAQQGGISDAGKPYPARPVVAMNAADLAAVVARLSLHIQQGGSLISAV